MLTLGSWIFCVNSNFKANKILLVTDGVFDNHPTPDKVGPLRTNLFWSAPQNLPDKSDLASYL